MAIKFATNIPQTLAFPYGDSKEVEGNFGPQHMYTVEVNGEKDRLYASPYLHDQLQAGGVGAGSVLTITKVELEGGKTGWQISTDAPASGQAPLPAAPTNGAAPRPINGHAPHNRTHYTHLLAAAISDAATAAHLANVKIDSEGGATVAFTSADIEKLAVHLSITYQQKNVPLKEEQAPAPIVAPAPAPVEAPPIPTTPPPVAVGSTGEDDLPF